MNTKNKLVGTIKILNKGYGFVLTKLVKREIFIPKNYTNYALNNDIVEIKIQNSNKKYNIGKVIKILKRSKNKIIGVLKKKLYLKKYIFLIYSKSLHTKIEIPINKLKKAKEHDKVVVKIKNWNKNKLYPSGYILKILGKSGKYNTELKAILSEYKISNHFSKQILKEANKINKIINKKEVLRRRDMRNELTFTVDPENAKDFDDAISFKKKNQKYIIGVHIADVSHYVTENSIIDNEAYKRSNSIYFIDKVIPMLPDVLSNDLCSLNEKQDKLTLSIVFTLDQNYQILEYWIGRTIINSNKSFTYEEIQNIINTKQGLFKKEILQLKEITKKLKKNRIKDGSILFNSSELKFKINKENKPINIYTTSKNSNAQNIIEELMLLANKKICETYQNNYINKSPCIYRVHDQPNYEKLKILKKAIKTLGYRLPKTNKNINIYINKLLNKVKNKPEENIINTLIIRTMSKACYSTKNIGHYGLAFKYYTHFTSPIRRYPDIVMHRLIKNMIFNQKNINIQIKNTIKEKDAIHFSHKEKISIDAEREFIKFMQIKYLQNFIGKIFIGIISGITDWLIYVDLIDLKIDGILHKIYNKNYKLGKKIQVKIKKINIDKRQVYLEYTQK